MKRRKESKVKTGRSSGKRAEPTAVSLVGDELLGAKDFRTVPQIMAATGLAVHQIATSLRHLRLHKAVDCLEEAGALYWFATPEKDTRVFVLPNRVKEEPNTRAPGKRRKA